MMVRVFDSFSRCYSFLRARVYCLCGGFTGRWRTGPQESFLVCVCEKTVIIKL